jgi:hypothetical protein
MNDKTRLRTRAGGLSQIRPLHSSRLLVGEGRAPATKRAALALRAGRSASRRPRSNARMANLRRERARRS